MNAFLHSCRFKKGTALFNKTSFLLCIVPVSVNKKNTFLKEAAGFSCKQATWPSGTAERLQILRDGFDSRLELNEFDLSNWWLLIRRAQAYYAVFLSCRIFVQYNLRISRLFLI